MSSERPKKRGRPREAGTTVRSSITIHTPNPEAKSATLSKMDEVTMLMEAEALAKLGHPVFIMQYAVLNRCIDCLIRELRAAGH